MTELIYSRLCIPYVILFCSRHFGQIAGDLALEFHAKILPQRKVIKISQLSCRRLTWFFRLIQRNTAQNTLDRNDSVTPELRNSSTNTNNPKQCNHFAAAVVIKLYRLFGTLGSKSQLLYGKQDESHVIEKVTFIYSDECQECCRYCGCRCSLRDFRS